MLTLAAEATHDPTSIALAVGIVIFVIGVLGIVIPVLPGLLLCVAAVLVWAGFTGGTTAWPNSCTPTRRRSAGTSPSSSRRASCGGWPTSPTAGPLGWS